LEGKRLAVDRDKVSHAERGVTMGANFTAEGRFKKISCLKEDTGAFVLKGYQTANSHSKKPRPAKLGVMKGTRGQPIAAKN